MTPHARKTGIFAVAEVLFGANQTAHKPIKKERELTYPSIKIKIENEKDF